MLIWISLAVLFFTPLVIHLRGGGIVALSISVAALYGVGGVLALIATLFPDLAGSIFNTLNPAAQGSETALHDTYLVAPQAKTVLLPAALFALIGLVFWALFRWGAPRHDEALKNLFWLLHTAILAIPFATAVFMGAGMPASYFDGSAGFSVFAMTSMIVSILVLIALVGFLWFAAKAAFGRLRM